MTTNFAIFIMVWGDPTRQKTLKSLRRHGYKGKIYFVADDLDPTLEEYQKLYGDDLLVFSKLEIGKKIDAGDNSGDLRSTVYASNAIHDFAKKLGIRFYGIFCDDYSQFRYKIDSKFRYKDVPIKSLDQVLTYLVDYYKSISATSIAIAQGGDYIGGDGNNIAESLGVRRKVMNTFICSIDRPFQFLGRLNEDVTTYTTLGSRGVLFFTYPLISIQQPETQKSGGGLSSVYQDNGTYIKSFFSVMYSPSCVKVATVGIHFPRIHHQVSWKNAVPYIIREEHKKR